MARLQFGTFLAPHHPLGESPTTQFQRDLDFAEHLDRWGFDEFWVGEHHSSGWEMIASPEMFLAAAGQRTHRIRLGTGVISLPYHHPFNVAQRIVQLDHMTRGRAMFGSGPGALPSDARTLNIDALVQRDRQDEAHGVIIRLLRGEPRFDYDCEWFTLRDAALQILPIQDDLPMVTASSISPSGMQIAGKHGKTVDRRNWRVLMSWHLAETREQARNEAVYGLQRWHNEYNVQILGRPGANHVDNAWELLDEITGNGAVGAGAAVIGTPDDLIAAIRNLQELTGGFGVVLGFAHDWANKEATARSWEMVARYVVPALQGTVLPMQASADYVEANKATLMASAGAAVMQKIMAHEGAQAAMVTTMQQMADRANKRESAFRPGGGLAAETEADTESV